MGDELEERIRNLEDRAALWELVNRYGMAVDDGDYDTLLGLFAEDATFRGLQGIRRTVGRRWWITCAPGPHCAQLAGAHPDGPSLGPPRRRSPPRDW